MSKKFNHYHMQTQELPQEANIPSLAPEIEFVPPVHTKPTFTHNQIHEALMFVQEVMERSSFYDFMLLGDIAKAVHSTDLPNFEMGEIEVGITKSQYTESGKSMFHSVLHGYKIYPRQYDDRFEFEYKNVPVIFRLLDDSFSFAKRPDSRFYMMTEFKIPNPFNKYLESIK